MKFWLLKLRPFAHIRRSLNKRWFSKILADSMADSRRAQWGLKGTHSTDLAMESDAQKWRNSANISTTTMVHFMVHSTPNLLILSTC